MEVSDFINYYRYIHYLADILTVTNLHNFVFKKQKRDYTPFKAV